MSTINILNIRNELCDFLRRSDVLSTTIRGVTRTTGSYIVGVGGEAAHTFAGNIPARDFKLLTVDLTQKYYLRDFTMNWETGVLTWNTPLVAGQAVAYQLDWGGQAGPNGLSDKIYPDYPRDDMTFSQFPRIGIAYTSDKTVPLGLGGANHITDILVTIFCWVPANKDSSGMNFGGLPDLETLMSTIRDKIRINAKLFYTFFWISPKNISSIFAGKNNKLLGQSADFEIRFVVE